MNYYSQLPIDKGGSTMQEFATPFPSRATLMTDNAAVSSAISLGPNTTTVEVGAINGQGVVIRWVAATETAAVAPRASVVASGLGANFDHYIAPNTVRRFAVPKETQGIGTGNMQIGSTYGLYQRIARINAGTAASSILVTEF